MFWLSNIELCLVKMLRSTHIESVGDHVVAPVRVRRVEVLDWFGTAGSVHAGPVCTLVTVSPAGAAVAAEGYRVGEHGVGHSRAARKDGCAVLHLVIGAASLDNVT